MRLCPFCSGEIYEDSIKCIHCGKEITNRKKTETHKCSACGRENARTVWVNEKEVCIPCVTAMTDKIIVTTTNSVEGKKISKYIGVESTEIVIGTGIISEIITDIQDSFGLNSTEFEIKLNKARQISIQKLKLICVQKNGDAIIGLDLDYTEFSGNRIGVIASGTLVSICE